jgi:hypothetical protein
MIDGPSGESGQNQSTPPANEDTTTSSTLLGGGDAPAGSDLPAGDKPADTPKEGDQPSGDTPSGDQTVEYQLVLPENAVIDDTTLERTAATARELGLSNEHAQRLTNFLNEESAARDAAFLESNRPGGAEWTARTTEWAQKALADPEIGGSPEKLQTSVGLAKRALTEFFPPEVGQFLEESGFGSNPALLRGLAKIGRTISEGDIHQPDTRAHGKVAPADVLYDKTVETK